MLAIIEDHLQALGTARSEAEIGRILALVARDFGFRSVFLIEYAGKLTGVQHVIDTNASRKNWWGDYFSSDLRPTAREMAAAFAGASVHRFDLNRFGAGSDALKAACAANDVLEVTAVPISHEGELVGVAGFCGAPALDKSREMALQLVAYSAFASLRSSHRSTAENGHDVTLTPREREVMRLSAEGLTSAEIATRLGMSPRTANQHIDNVADKLGTRNRAHTVAESVRRGLL